MVWKVLLTFILKLFFFRLSSVLDYLFLYIFVYIDIYIYIYRERERKYYTSQSKVLHTLLNVTSEVSIDKIVLNKTKYLTLNSGAMGSNIYIYLGSKLSFIHVLLKRMAHSLFIIFFLMFSYFLISFIFLWSFCKISIIVLKEGATFRFTRTIFRLKIVYGNLNRSKIGFIIP